MIALVKAAKTISLWGGYPSQCLAWDILFGSLVVVRINNKYLFIVWQRSHTIAILMRGQLPQQQPQNVQQAAQERHQDYSRYRTQKDAVQRAAQQSGQAAAAGRDTREMQKPMPITVEKKPRPNDPCPCGSGKKFKQCHGKGL